MSPLRHWHGSVPSTRVAWKCPTCGADNTGALEEGCATCKAGKDAAPAQRPRATSRSPFEQWAERTHPQGFDLGGWSLASEAWDAGVAWAHSQQAPPPTSPESRANLTEDKSHTVVLPTGGWTLALVAPDTHEPTLTDARTHHTVLAALAFYRDNHLAYAAVPGQLTAEEVRELIEQLSPQAAEEAP